jgi:hypothetical protein
MVNDLRLKVIVRIVDIGLIVEYYCPYFLFIIWKIYPILGYCEMHIFISNIHNNTNDAMMFVYLDIILWEI